MTTTAGEGRLCAAKNARGEPCQAYALTGSRFCWHHAPERAADRAAAHSKGGKARHGRRLNIGEPPPAVLRSPDDALAILEHAVSVALALDPSHAQIRSLVAIVGAWRTVREIGELEQRLAALESAAFGAKG